MKEYPVTCYCGSPAHLHSNERRYGRKVGNVPFMYICDRYIAAIEKGQKPPCLGTVGVHPSGKPLGKIPDEQTKVMRRKLHAIVDAEWQNRRYSSRRNERGRVYGWLRRITGMSAEECHIGNFDADTCLKVMKLIQENPYEGDK
jgi:hypothetical protein